MKFGETNAATRVIYGLVGIAGVALAAALVMPERALTAVAATRSEREGHSYSS